METPYLVKKGAKIARAEMQNALEAYERIVEASRASGDHGNEIVDIYKEPLADLYKTLCEINEWLYAIEGER